MSEDKINYGKIGPTTEKYGAYSSIGFYPIKDQIIVRPLFVQPISQNSNIILPDSISEKTKNDMVTFDKYPYQAIVIAVGPGFDKEHPMLLRPGQRVYMNQPFSNELGRMFLWNKINYYKCQEGNICGIADEDIDNPLNDKITEPIKDKKGKIIPMSQPVIGLFF
jgi:co-chaperonin GroES (HSP10)